MNFGSVCSGIEAASMAWNPLGWRAQFVSEIDRFPCELLKVRHPDVPNFGDMTQFHEWPDANIDVLVGGTPCQSFSVAGLRKGLDDPRGNLMLTYLAIAARYRPRWLVWENVPGVLSSGGGRDFGSLLGGLAELGYGFAYRVLDAQYFNLAQRRERVFVVGCLGDWRSAAAVLFERSSLQGNPAPNRQTGANVAASLTAGSHPASNAPGRRREDDVNLVSHTLLAKPNDAHDASMQTYIAQTLGANSGRNQIEATYVTHALTAEGFDAGEDGTGRGTPLTIAIRGRAGESTLEWNDDWIANAILTPNGGRGGIGVGAVAFNARQDPDHWNERTGPLDTDGSTQAVAFSCKDHGADSGPISPTLRAMGHAGSHANAGGQVAVQTSMSVRRLTPRECERLQGFPDDYTLIQRKGKAAADGPRCKALGNSMAVPVMAWIGRRIDQCSAAQRDSK